MTITILTERELRDCISLDEEIVDVVADAFAAWARGEAVMPPILRLDIEDANGEMDVKTAYVRGFDSFCLKVSTGFFDNPKLGLPSLSGMMTLLSAKTGKVEAVLLDNGYLTDIRTAAAGAVAARQLTRADARVAGIIGAGTQARLQLEALRLVRPIESAYVWARDGSKASDFAAKTSRALGLSVEVRESAEEVVRAADVVVATTPARAPIVQADWLHPGLHVTAMGSDAEDKNELHPDVLAAADRYVCDSPDQVRRMGELHHAVESGAVGDDFVFDTLGGLLEGRGEGRKADSDVTVCDLTGMGVQDTAIALVAARKAAQKGYGTAIEA